MDFLLRARWEEDDNMISDYVKNEIKSHAEQDTSRECCGFIFKDNILRCNNRSEKPARHFTISPFDYIKAAKKGKIKAVYHSHVSENQNFSIRDKQMSRGHNIPFVLYHLKTKNFLCYDPKKERIVDISKKFVLGKSDCYTLVKDYYKDLGIELAGTNNLGENWLKKNPNLIEDLFELNKTDSEDEEAYYEKKVNQKVEMVKDFYSGSELPISRIDWCVSSGIKLLKKHDVIVFEMIKGAGPCHVGVYLGDGIMYHHPRNRFPTTEELTSVVRKKIYKIYRHQGLNEQG